VPAVTRKASWCVCLITALLMAALPAGKVHAQPVSFNIAAGSGPASLRQFAEQAHVQILFDYKALEAVRTPAVTGVFGPDEALALLLRDTEFIFNRINASTYAIQPARSLSGELLVTPDPAAQAVSARPPKARSPGRFWDGVDTGGPMPEVVVTATRRAENQFDVPMTMTVIGAAQIGAQELQTFHDFASVVPNLNFNHGAPNGFFGGNTDDRAVAIRGIQGSDTTGFYLDELPIPPSMNPRLPDLERIEVLKGPQGTLYGARSMGGTVRLITRRPSLEGFSVSLGAQGTSIDGGGSGYAIHGALNLPLLSDVLALRITPYRGQDGGYINRVWPTTQVGVQHVQRNSAQLGYSGIGASLLWKPVENLSVRPIFLYQSSSTNGLPMGDFSAANLTNVRHFDIPEGLAEKFWVAGMTVDLALPAGTITSATAFLDRRTSDREDLSEFTAFAFGTPLFSAPVEQFAANRNVSQELRFTSSWNHPLHLTGGLFYRRTSSSVDFVQQIEQFLPIYGTTVVAANHGKVTEYDRAIFGELTYAITPRWSLTVGGRYSRNNTLFTLYAWGAAFGAVSQADAVPTINRERDGVLTPKFLVKYQPTENLNIYADAVKGFRPGSGQLTPDVEICASEYARVGLTPEQLSSFKADSVWSYELGAKVRSVNRRFALNTALFWIQWIQKRQILPLACGFSAVINSGSARSRGVELDFSLVPIDGLTLTGGIGYDDATVLDPGSLLTFPTPGSRIVQVAPLSGNLSAKIERGVGAGTRLIFQADYSYTAHSYSATTSAQEPLLRPAYSLVDVRTALNRGPIEAALFVKNLGDAHPNFSEGYSIGGFVPGRLRWNTGTPRLYGFEVTATF